MRILLTGSSGFIGQNLKKRLEERGDEVFILKLSSENTNQDGTWNPIAGWLNFEQKDIDGIVHLAGESPLGRWSKEKKEAIYESRIRGTKLLVKNFPQVRFFLSASGMGYYGDRGDEELTEFSKPGSSFLAKVCTDWETATAELDKSVRVCHLRFSGVLGKGGPIEQVIGMFKMGGGGILGKGDNFVSWISLEDTMNIILHLINNEHCQGPYNIVSPVPTTSKEFSKTIGKAIWRPVFMPIPIQAVRVAVGEMADEMLFSSAKVIPQRLLEEEKFSFQHQDLYKLFQEIVR